MPWDCWGIAGSRRPLSSFFPAISRQNAGRTTEILNLVAPLCGWDEGDVLLGSRELSLIHHRKPSPALDTGYGPTRWLHGAGEQSLCGSIGSGGMYPVGVRSVNPPHGVCVKRDPRLHQRVLHSPPFPGGRIMFFAKTPAGRPSCGREEHQSAPPCLFEEGSSPTPRECCIPRRFLVTG